MHKGVYHVLKLMLESAINTEVFPNVHKKKEITEISSKLKMTLLQGGDNDMNLNSPCIASRNACNDNKIATRNYVKPLASEVSSLIIDAKKDEQIMVPTMSC
jgi:hypothetical protein